MLRVDVFVFNCAEINLFKYFFDGFLFESTAQVSEFRFRVFSTVLLVATIFAPIFAALHYLGQIDITDFHASIDLSYGIFSLLVWLGFRRRPENYFLYALLFAWFSLFVFVSAYVFAVHDEFRAIWFYILVTVSFVLLPRKWGDIFAVLSVLALLIGYNLFETGISEDAIVSSVLGMLPFALILRAYAKQSDRQVFELSEKNAKLVELASKDELTKSYNRRMFYELGAHLFAMAKREETPLSMMMFDLDNFKSINDSYGHLVGDEVLRRFSLLCMSSQRENDVFSRIGGEEFVLMLPNTDAAGAMEIAERFLKVISNMSCRIEEHDLCVTVSIGVTQINQADVELENLRVRADAALYEAKTAGRNQVKLMVL